mgnify:CR=1 FL=1
MQIWTGRMNKVDCIMHEVRVVGWKGWEWRIWMEAGEAADVVRYDMYDGLKASVPKFRSKASRLKI